MDQSEVYIKFMRVKLNIRYRWKIVDRSEKIGSAN